MDRPRVFGLYLMFLIWDSVCTSSETKKNVSCWCSELVSYEFATIGLLYSWDLRHSSRRSVTTWSQWGSACLRYFVRGLKDLESWVWGKGWLEVLNDKWSEECCWLDKDLVTILGFRFSLNLAKVGFHCKEPWSCHTKILGIFILTNVTERELGSRETRRNVLQVVKRSIRECHLLQTKLTIKIKRFSGKIGVGRFRHHFLISEKNTGRRKNIKSGIRV